MALPRSLATILPPPHSAVRSVYPRFFRLAEKINDRDGAKAWPDELERRYWRFWFALVRRARAPRGQKLDEAEINRLMDWDAC